ncbi:MAG: DNA primase [Caldilineaceae bacterium]|nr:DNA primase [Caldilineaceae bacterium]
MSVVDEIKQRIDVVDFIGRYMELRKAGTTYKGLCPFHQERTPSFIVFPDSGTWHCFGSCGTGGDIFSFLMRRENLEFREVLELLARETGVALEEEQDPAQGQRSRLYELNDAATTYFYEILRHHTGASDARAYLARRGITDETAANFRLGFALDSWSGLRDFLLAKGWSLEEQLEAGLIKRNDERNSSYDAFRGRVMIPIRDRQGRVIGFGGRSLGDGQPKYLNTAETPLFHKSQVIFGLDLAREAIRREDKVVIVEGYMDVIAAHQHGFANVVACMGTSLTSEQLQQLHRFTNHFVLALDADAAGQQATIRGLNQARQSLLRVQKPTVTASGQVRLTERLTAELAIVSMPTGLDPDDVIRRDPQAWQKLVQQAQPLVDFYFRFIAQQYDLASAQGKGIAVAEIAPLIAELDDEIERQHYIQQLSRAVQIDEMTILSRVQAAAKTSKLPVEAAKRNRTDRPTLNGHRQPGSPKTQPQPALGESTPLQGRAGAGKSSPITQEEHLVANLLREPNLLVWLASAVERLEIGPLRPEELQSVQNQELLKALRQYIAGDEQWDLELFQDVITPHLHGHLAKLISYGTQLPPCTIGELRLDTVQTLIHLRLEQLRIDARHLKFLQDDAAQQGDMQGAKQLAELNNQQIRELFHLQQSKHSLPRMLTQSGELRSVA